MKSREKVFKHDGKQITYREAEVLLCCANGLTITQTSEVLFISYTTVKTHRENIRSRFMLNGYNALMCFAIKLRPELEKSVDILSKIGRKED